MIAAIRVRAPDRRFTAVRAMAPVAGMPPKKPAATEASPWPTSSRSASYGPVSEMDAATRAESSDSIAASAATVSTGPTRAGRIAGSMKGTDGAGSELGSAPIRVTGRAVTVATTVTRTMPMIEPGSLGWMRGATIMIAATTATTARSSPRVGHDIPPNDCTAATRALVLVAVVDPIAAGTCCRKMMTAMPSVNPSMTGHGMYDTTWPSRNTPARSTTTPASTLTSATTPTPWLATMGASTTTIAPVGPETCTSDPPKTAATRPATIAVMSPASAPAPELTPKARASGSATMPTVIPATRSPRQVRRSWR
jgi:hypothetical protein